MEHAPEEWWRSLRTMIEKELEKDLATRTRSVRQRDDARPNADFRVSQIWAHREEWAQRLCAPGEVLNGTWEAGVAIGVQLCAWDLSPTEGWRLWNNLQAAMQAARKFGGGSGGMEFAAGQLLFPLNTVVSEDATRVLIRLAHEIMQGFLPQVRGIPANILEETGMGNELRIVGTLLSSCQCGHHRTQCPECGQRVARDRSVASCDCSDHLRQDQSPADDHRANGHRQCSCCVRTHTLRNWNADQETLRDFLTQSITGAPWIAGRAFQIKAFQVGLIWLEFCVADYTVIPALIQICDKTAEGMPCGGTRHEGICPQCAAPFDLTRDRQSTQPYITPRATCLSLDAQREWNRHPAINASQFYAEELAIQGIQWLEEVFAKCSNEACSNFFSAAPVPTLTDMLNSPLLTDAEKDQIRRIPRARRLGDVRPGAIKFLRSMTRKMQPQCPRCSAPPSQRPVHAYRSTNRP